MLSRLRRILKVVGRDLLVLWYSGRDPATPWFVKLGACRTYGIEAKTR
jgi:uncharacterized membrane protein YkvA (DUF1232 family)